VLPSLLEVISVTQETTSREERGYEEDARWQAVLARDAGADGAFVYAVRSTGIYCRPSCPSRRPGREQVRFFSMPEAAERAGYRACRRCLPRETPAQDPRVEMVQRACRCIDAHPEDPPTLADLGAQLGVSPHHLQRTFKHLVGITPHQYAAARRLGRLKAQLKEGQDVTNALYEAGYSSSSRLYERAADQLGMTPATYRRGGQGMRIRYTIVDGPALGKADSDRLLVAATERGLCFVSLGDSETALAAALSHEYPAAEISRDASDLTPWVNALVSHIGGRQPHLDLPLDVQATAFQRQVWEALRAIPYGSTRSYSEIARAIGHPAAARAVGHACATNPVAVVIPCHRAVREDGTLGGYRWGLERKRALLAQEKGSPGSVETGEKTG
jgi:AraC family transcriptional regulator, regulatory protein of adaptative response / methylated-DNA-[protein]-cysteine methyltransferase